MKFFQINNSISIFFFTRAAISTSEGMMVGLGMVVKNCKGEIITTAFAGDVELAEVERVCVIRTIELMIIVY